MVVVSPGGRRGVTEYMNTEAEGANEDAGDGNEDGVKKEMRDEDPSCSSVTFSAE